MTDCTIFFYKWQLVILLEVIKIQIKFTPINTKFLNVHLPSVPQVIRWALWATYQQNEESIHPR